MKSHTAGAYIGVFFVLVISVIGVVNQFAQLPHDISRQTAEAVTGAACEMNSFSTGKNIGVETPATEIQKKTCTPTSCWLTPEGKQVCMIKPAAQGMAGGGGGLMDAIGGMLKNLLQPQQGGGGSGSGSGYTPYVDPQYGVAPKCATIESDKGVKPVRPGDMVTIIWTKTGGDAESITLSPSAAGSIGATGSPMQIKAPEKSTTYTLTLTNRTGASSCSVRVYVTPGGSTEAEDGVTSTNSRNSDIIESEDEVGTEDASLDNPIGGGYSDIASERSASSDKSSGEDGSETSESEGAGVLGGVLKTVTGLISGYGQKENFETDASAFQNDPYAFQNDQDAFGGDAFGSVVDDLGKDGIYSKEDIETLEKLSKELDAQRAASKGQRPAYDSPLSQAELSALWTRPDSSVSGGLGDNYETAAYERGQESSGVLTSFMQWVKNTFCFWCVTSVSSHSLNGSMLLGAAPAAAPAAAPKAPAAVKPKTLVKKAEPKVEDKLTPKCAALNEKKKKEIEGYPDSTKASFLADFEKNDKVIPVEEVEIDGKGNVKKKDLGGNDCRPKKEIEKVFGKVCAECANGVAIIPPRENIDIKKTCGSDVQSNPKGTGVTKLALCRENPDPQDPRAREECLKKAGDDEAKKKSCDTPAPADPANPGPPNAGPGNPDNKTPPNQAGGDPMKALSEALKNMGQQSSQKPSQQQDPCSSAGAATNPQCNPAIPTEPPKCVEDSFAASPAIIYKGQSSDISWAVTGKGTITTIINYVTRNEQGAEEKGSLGAVSGGSVSVSPERSTTYTLKATNEIGTVTCKPVRLSVRPKTEEDDTVFSDDGTGLSTGDLVLTCDPGELQRGSEGEVTWEACPSGTKSTLGTSTEDASFATNGDPSGSVVVKPLRDSTYVVRCRDEFNNTLQRKSCSIHVTDGGTAVTTATEPTKGDRPAVEITAPPTAVYGQSVRVEWKSKNAVSCVVYGPGCDEFGRGSPKCFKEVGRAGYVVGNIYTTSVFSVECRGKDRKTVVTDDVTVSVDDGSSGITEEFPLDDAAVGDAGPTDAGPTLEELLGE